MKLRDLLIFAGGIAAVSQAGALSLGNSQGRVQLGSPLDLLFQVHADAGQTAQSSCLSADVWMGDTPLASSQVLLTAQEKSVRIRTTTPVYEPLITLKLNAGCTGAVSRSYTFFADPPSSMAATMQPIDLSKIQLSTLPATATTRSATPAIKSEKPARIAKRAVNPNAFKETLLSPSAGTPALTALVTAVNAVGPATNTSPEPAPAPSTTGTESEKPRLRIEPLEGLDSQSEVAAAAASSDLETTALVASALIDPETQLLLDANASRLEAMEQQLQTLQQQLSRNRSEIVGLQTQLVQAQNPDLPIWVHLMLGLLALALATIAWLIQRIKQERLNAHRSWADTVLAVEDSQRATTIDTQENSARAAVHPASAPLPEQASTSASPALQALETSPAPSPDVKEDPQSHTLYQEFEQLQSGHSTPDLAPSIAEVLTAQALFDVQEQAEFYASIGENDQAIAILQAHIAEHEASSPLAYIELLQLLYRLSRTEAYEEVREKFQAHFNVQVPNFLGFSRKGRDLWSGHPDVLSQIEAKWPTEDVQHLLRGLILRSHTPGLTESQTRFDLSAFDELLMLYNVAKTTPASSRGQLPGRTRTAPIEAPLPEVVFDHGASTPVTTYQTPSVDNAPVPSPPLPLNEAYLDLLSAAPAQTPLAPPAPYTDSPFQTPSHFAPNEALIDGLSLDWGSAAPSTQTAEVENRQVLNNLDAELQAFMMDERDLPKDNLPSSAT